MGTPSAKERMKPLRDRLLQLTQEGTLWQREKNDAVRCFACGHRCFIPAGFDGICKVRSNQQGRLRVPWGYVAGLQIDPIEKKPFFHALPGQQALSFGMLGCDFHCGYCQNWITSQSLRDENASARAEPIPAESVVKLARQSGAKVLTSTYNEPLITAEWGMEIFKAGKRAGLVTSFVSNGNGTPEVLDFIRPHTDLYKIDLKGFRDKPYRELGGVLANVMETIRQVHARGFWLEIVTLIIPGFNDDRGELKELCEFLVSVSPDIPWHATAFHSDYKMASTPPTPISTLYAAAEIAKQAGLRYVYLGNRPGQVGDWENTLCHHCQIPVIRRHGFRILENRLSAKGECPACHHPLPGFW